jgi:hypothetical protein
VGVGGAQLQDAVHYWLCTVRTDGRPHCAEVGCVDRRQDLLRWKPGHTPRPHLALNPAVVIHLEGGEQAVIVEGSARAIEKPAVDLAARVAAAYRQKYAGLGYAPEPTQWDAGGLFEIAPHAILAWTRFAEDATKFVLAA